MTFSETLKSAVDDLQGSPTADPLPVLRNIIKECPRKFGFDVPTIDASTVQSSLQLCIELQGLIKNGKGSVPQVSSLALCCILPAVIGVVETATIFASALAIKPTSDPPTNFLSSLVQHIKSAVVKLGYDEDTLSAAFSQLNLETEEKCIDGDFTPHLHLVNAIMLCPSSKLLLLQIVDQQNGLYLLNSLYNVIEASCVSLVTRNHPSTLKALTSWIPVTKEAVRPSNEPNGCEEDNPGCKIADSILPCLNSCLSIINSCLWDGKAFGMLLDLADVAREHCSPELKGTCRFNSSNLLLCAMWELPWRNKRKFQMLAELLPRCGAKHVLDQYSDLPTGLLLSLEFNELQSAGADVYKAVLKALPEKDFDHHFTIIHVASLKNKNLIKGFSNYWLPALMKKYINLVKILEKTLKGDLLAQIVLLQQQRREGFITLQVMLETPDYFHLLCNGLSTFDLDIRIRSFDALCTGISQSIGTIPADTMNTALKLAHGFIMDNISVACQAARHSFVRSVSSLLPAVRDFLSIVLKNHPKGVNLIKTEDSKPSSSFIRWLYHFLVHNLEPGNNYQRHITALRLYQAVLQTFNSEATTTKVPLKLIISALKACHCWMFGNPSGAKAILRCVLSPTDDVRDTAAQILTSNRILASKLPPAVEILSEGLRLCMNQQFCMVESGAVLFTVGAHIYPEPRSQLFVELLTETERQFAMLQQGLLKGALEGSPVHGVLQALLYLLQDDKATQPIPLSILASVIDLVERVTAHLLTLLTSKSTSQDFAPSFEDMDWAIETQIYQDYNVEDKSIQLSPHYQIALNCAWLNLKVCCELASTLGCLLSKRKDDIAHITMTEQCGQILISVLQKCRHKGAFESAGVALASFVRTSSSNGCGVHEILLSRIMTTLTLNGKDAPPLSRRSAGLAVAVHKIVSADVDVEKVLLHQVIDQLLNGLHAEEGTDEGAQGVFVDTLSARLMHVLFTLVSDAATRHQTSRHLEKVALAAMKRLGCSNWGIRNAAMQLYGAVVNKLTTQRQLKRGEDEEDQVVDPVEDWDMVGSGLLEDLYLSRPNLLSYLSSQLNSEAQILQPGNVFLKNYTSLIFHLGLLIRLTPGPPSLRTPPQSAAIADVLASCWALIGCPEWTVRVQAVSCILTLTSIPQIPQLLARARHEMTEASENRKHGCLMLIAKTENKISLFLELLPKELGLKKCHTSSITLSKAQIKPIGSYACHQFIKFKDIKKGDFFRILRELSKYPCSKHVAKMLWTANLAENVVLNQKSIPPPEILDKCLEAESLFYIQERVLSTMYSMILDNELSDQLLDIQLILYETLDQVLITMDCSRHKLLLVIKVLVAIKRKTTEKYIKDNMPDFHFPPTKKELESANKIKQWILVVCGETLWVQPLISLLEENLYGDEFELFAFELLGLHALELMAAGYAQESVDVLTALTDLMQRNLQEELPDRASVGRALAAISPIAWNLQQLCSYYKVSSCNIGYIILLTTGELLSEHNMDAARSVWPLSAKRNGETLNPVFCLRQMCKLGAEKLMTSKMIYTYLWQQLMVNPEELKEIVDETDSLASPFSHSCGMDLETLDFIASGFKYLDNYRKHLISKDPQLAALMPDYNIHLPGSTLQELRVNTKELVDSITTFRQQTAGKLQWLPLELQVAIRKLTLQLWLNLETLQEQGIDLSLTDLDGTSAEERVYHLRRHLNTRNQLDNPDYN